MKKIINTIILFVLLLSTISVKAQTDVISAYWDDVDFRDTALISSSAFAEKMVSYFYSFTDGDEQYFDSLSIMGLGVLLDKVKVNMRVYEYVLEFALNGYDAIGRDAVTDFLLNYPQLAEGEVTKEEGLRLDSISEPYQKVRVGAQAPGFKDVTIDGKVYGIYDSKASHTIIVFWSTDCEYCHDFLVQIRRHLNLKSDFELVTFALADDLEEVNKAVKKMRLPGYHFYDKLRWESKAFLDYHITSTPTVFVLNENKTIVCKPYDWKELRYWLKSNNISY
jgi:thiol-disulfide isomerase/thioredoxin